MFHIPSFSEKKIVHPPVCTWSLIAVRKTKLSGRNTDLTNEICWFKSKLSGRNTDLTNETCWFKSHRGHFYHLL